MNSDNLQQILNFIYLFGIITCMVSIFVSLLKGVMNNDEMPNHLKKIKNSLVALILVLTIATIINFTQDYFILSKNSSDFGIGTSTHTFAQIDDNTSLNDEDKQGREIVIIDGQKYVVTDRNVKHFYVWQEENMIYYSTNAPWGNCDVVFTDGVDVLKKFSESQGLTNGSGLTTKVAYYRASKNSYEELSGVTDNKNGYAPSQYLKIDPATNSSQNMGYIFNTRSIEQIKKDINSGDIWRYGIGNRYGGMGSR